MAVWPSVAAGVGVVASGTAVAVAVLVAVPPAVLVAITDTQSSCSIPLSSPSRPRTLGWRVDSSMVYVRSNPSWLRTVMEPSDRAVTWPVWVSSVTVPHPSLVATANSPCIAPTNPHGLMGGSSAGVGDVVGAGVSAGGSVGVGVSVAGGTGVRVAAEAETVTARPPVATIAMVASLSSRRWRGRSSCGRPEVMGVT
ncbi:hypothetical protein [[Actinomadura] parvosata]|uniref:hypothetical protein n=1 Tax=[Actinomadura] parvosata TaxID=1955412 RepID=UPI0016483E24